MINLGLHSWHDFIATAARRLVEPQISGPGSSMRYDRGKEWDDNLGLTGALRLARDGWQAGVKEVSTALDKLPPESDALSDWLMDVSGFICNVPGFVAGDPECMLRLADCHRPHRRIALCVSGVYSAGTPASVVMRYATAIAATVRYLEASGIDVAVYSINTSKVVRNTIYGITVKEFGEPLDLAKVAFAFHPAFFRRIGFAWREITPAAVEAAISGQHSGRYGVAEPLTVKDLHSLLQDQNIPVVLMRGFYDGIDHGSVEYFMSVIREDIEKAIKQM